MIDLVYTLRGLLIFLDYQYGCDEMLTAVLPMPENAGTPLVAFNDALRLKRNSATDLERLVDVDVTP